MYFFESNMEVDIWKVIWKYVVILLKTEMCF